MLYFSYSVFHKEFPVLLNSLSSTRSSESFIWLFSISTFVMMCLLSLAPLRAPNSSSLGKETFLRGAIFVLDVVRVTMHSSCSGMTLDTQLRSMHIHEHYRGHVQYVFFHRNVLIHERCMITSRNIFISDVGQLCAPLLP